MSVATYVSLGSPDNEGLRRALERWPVWQAEYEALRVVPDLLHLPAWLRRAPLQPTDDVLLALAELSSPEGGDDLLATDVLAWLLLPGARLVAYRLADLSDRIDEMVASQLWLEARTFPWRHGQKVAANIVMNTRKAVLRDLGVGSQGGVWSRRILVSPTAEVWHDLVHRQHFERGPSADEELADLFDWACGDGVITNAERDLLVALAEAADCVENKRIRRGKAGLMTPPASQAVANFHGITARTVRRRALRSLQELRAAYLEQEGAA